MKLSRPQRLTTALIMLFSLLFAQLAVAAYACPVDVPSPKAAVISMANMPGCTGMDMVKPALCGAHCDKVHQSADTPSAPIVQAFVPCSLELVLPRMDRSATVPPAATAALPLTRTTAPPMAIRHCCFRF
jgi:hypothetical protein